MTYWNDVCDAAVFAEGGVSDVVRGADRGAGDEGDCFGNGSFDSTSPAAERKQGLSHRTKSFEVVSRSPPSQGLPSPPHVIIAVRKRSSHYHKVSLYKVSSKLIRPWHRL